MAINGIGNIGSISTISVPTLGNNTADEGNSTVSFGEYLNSALDQVNTLQIDAETAADDLALGKTDDIASVMIAEQKADVALQLTMQVRNKILDAYNEIMRMQI